MTNELVFRVLFSILWIVFISNITWVRYSIRGPKEKPSIDRTARREQQWRMVALALFAPFWFGGIILYIFIPGWIMFLSIPLPDWLRLTMAGVTALSIPFIIWAYRTIGKNWVHALDPSKFLRKMGDKLVTSGPYRYVRNPIYFGCFIFIIALAFVASNWLLLLPALVIITIIYGQIGKEEKMLLDRFGDEYREYMERTPRLIPRPWHKDLGPRKEL